MEFRKNRTAGAEFQWIGPMLFFVLEKEVYIEIDKLKHCKK